MQTILIVDDMEINRDILTEMLGDEYDILTASDGNEALELIKRHKDSLSLILLDLIMPGTDGFGVLNEMERMGWTKRIPVIIITGDDTRESERKGFAYGVSDFVRKPFDSNIIKLRVRNVVDLFAYKNNLEDRVAQQTEELKIQNLKLKKQAETLEQSNIRIIDILGNVVESRNLESGQHIQRVKTYTGILAHQLQVDYPEYGLDGHKVDVIMQASALHDVGKIAIPDSILLKPGRLTADEFEYMKSHTTKGCVILDNIEGVWDEEYAEMSHAICRHHHERYDGKGYPDGLKGDEIPISAQIVSIADVYDALVSERVYKDALPKDKAFSMIINGECGTFSPKLLECFKKVRRQFEKVGEQTAQVSASE